jgi:hypothetical protein
MAVSLLDCALLVAGCRLRAAVGYVPISFLKNNFFEKNNGWLRLFDIIFLF